MINVYLPSRTCSGVPIFEKPPPKYSAYSIMHILLDPNIDESRIARKRPLEAQFSCTFVVDVRNLPHQDDIKKDMYGRWIHSGSHTDVFLCSFGKKGKVCIEKAAKGASGKNVFFLRRLHSVHPSNSSFRRVLALLFGMFTNIECDISCVKNVFETTTFICFIHVEMPEYILS